MFKKEITIHEFAEDKDIQQLVELGFMQINDSEYEYNDNCYCKKCKEQRENNITSVRLYESIKNDRQGVLNKC